MEHLPERYLIIGDERDLGRIFAMLECFPWDAQGNVVLELPSGKRPPLSLPAGMSLTVLSRAVPWSSETVWHPGTAHPSARRSLEVHEPDTAARHHPAHLPRGERAADAMAAWITEWILPQDPGVHDYAMWVGMVGTERIDDLCAQLIRTVERIHLHRPWSAQRSDAPR